MSKLTCIEQRSEHPSDIAYAPHARQTHNKASIRQQYKRAIAKYLSCIFAMLHFLSFRHGLCKELGLLCLCYQTGIAQQNPMARQHDAFGLAKLSNGSVHCRPTSPLKHSSILLGVRI